MRTPLAWLNTTSSLPKLALASSGIGFAVVLMFMQIGFLNGLFDSTVQLLRLLDADLIVLSPARYTVPSEQRFDYGLLERARTMENVESAEPIYIDRSLSEVRVLGHVSRSIRTIGVPSDTHVFLDPTMNQKCELLTQSQMALLDRRSKSKYGFEKYDLEKLRAQEIELSGKQVRMMEWVDIGTDFVYDGSLVVNDRSVAFYFPLRAGRRPPLSAVDLGIIKVRPGSDILQTAKEVQETLGASIVVYEKQALIRREIGFWATNTPIGVIFSIGTVMGLVVGVIICYQILFTDIQDHIAEFATLKAMGYAPMFFLRFVLSQSFYLSLFGFVPGLIVSRILYYLLAEMTGLVMMLTLNRILLVFGLTFIMCTISGLLAVRRLWSADPATLFK